MLLRDLKYLLAYLVPVSVGVSIYMGGGWSLTTVIFVFGFIPIIEQIFPQNIHNHAPEEELSRKQSVFFDILLYLNVLIVFGMIGLFIVIKPDGPQGFIEWIGMVSAMGILFAANGINVAHELGHRNNTLDRMISKILLLPSHYMHFIIEHNYGHHKNVATPLDPATARKNESLYQFWIRSTWNSYINAWKMERQRLNSLGKSFYAVENEMIRFLFIQFSWNVMLFFLFGFPIWLTLFLAGIVGILLLESTNYIEHYGIMRKKVNENTYEPVMPHHSWNADFFLGRMMLYELTRHSDHHYKTDRNYQILRHIKEAPQLPWGYPASMLIASIPPLWFIWIHPRLNKME